MSELSREAVRRALAESIELKEKLRGDNAFLDQVVRMAGVLVKALRDGNHLYLCGNGGSASDAQHLATELVGRFQKTRAALPALALNTDTALLTAVANDDGFPNVFARQIEAFVRSGDVLMVISTSGNSPNVLEAARRGRALGARVLGLSGRDGGKLRSLCDECLVVPHELTCRIQEVHITVGHILCDIVEESLAPEGQ